jgi:hypothetical protein
MDRKRLTKDVIIVILALVVAGGVYIGYSKGIINFGSKEESPAPTEQVQNEMSDWKTYQDNKLGFELKYPNSSSVVDLASNGDFFNVEILYDKSDGSDYEPARLHVANIVHDSLTSLYNNQETFTNDIIVNEGEYQIYFYKNNQKIYADCVDYGKLGILDFCNQVLSTLKPIK